MEEETPEVDINISNVVCNFSTRCHLNLRTIATNGINVEYKREQGVCIWINYLICFFGFLNSIFPLSFI